MKPSRSSRIVVLAACSLFAYGTLAGSAMAAAPSNDDRAAARLLSNLPVTANGTTVNATLETVETPSSCGDSRGSVWYRLDSDADRRIVLTLTAADDMDAFVDVYRRERSQTTPIECDATDKTGYGSLAFNVAKDTSYLIRIARRPNSVAGSFKLTLAVAQPLQTPPGRPLPTGGADGTVYRVQNPNDAWSMSMRAGTTYRINMVARGETCPYLSLYLPGTKSFSERAVKTISYCGYILFTPKAGEGGTYVFEVQARGGVRGPQPYHLQAGRALTDDTSPGLGIRNNATIRGALAGSRLDVVDLYRFDIYRRSNLSLSIRSKTVDGFDLLVVNHKGKTVRCACGAERNADLDFKIRPGHYYAAVRADSGSNGRYSLTRISRTITRTGVAINGTGKARALPGQSTEISIRVKPGESGPTELTFQRFDPLFGWQFFNKRTFDLRNGHQTVSFKPPALGSWRVQAKFLGTDISSPSESGFASVLVAPKL